MLQRFGFDAEHGEGAALVAAHEAKIRSIQIPLLVIHGEWDELIPLQQAVELYDTLAHVPRELLIIPGAGHNDLMWAGLEDYFGAIRRFVSV